MSFVELLSPAVSVAQHTGVPVGTLFAEEEAAIADAVLRRRLEFACGRGCARQALAQLGFAPTSIPIGQMRQPLWPPGVVGSITHCRDFCAAAVAPKAAVRALGIDVESNVPMEEGVFRQVSTEKEHEHIQELLLTSGSTTPWQTLLFSAKESLYKAWFPWTLSWLDFSQASIHFEPDRLRFELTVHHPDAVVHGFPPCVSGGYRWTEKHVYTAIELPAGG